MTPGNGVPAQRHTKIICFLSSAHPALDKRVFAKEARSLAAAGYRVVHVCFGDEACQERDGVRIDVRRRRGGLVRRALSLVDLFRRARRIDAHVYHCNEVDSWLVGVLLKLLRGKRVIFDVHEHYPATFAAVHFPRFLHRPAAAFVRLVFRCLGPWTDCLVLAKTSVAEDFPGTEERQCAVLNAASLEYADLGPDDAPAGIRRLYAAAPTAVHLGVFSKGRGWPQLVEAMRRMRHRELCLAAVGTINDGSQVEFRQTVADCGLADRVTLHDWLPFEDAYRHVLCARIGLVVFQPTNANYVHAFPHKMFDYMLAGLPVIVPDFARDVVEIVRRADCGLAVDTTDPQAVADALDLLLDDPERARQLGQNGRRAVLEEFNWEAQFAKLLGLYDGWLVRTNPKIPPPHFGRSRTTQRHRAIDLYGSSEW